MKYITMEKMQLIKEANEKMFSKKIDRVEKVVFVYTPIKVGSTTLVSSIRISACNKFIVSHLHNENCLQILTGINNVTINEIIEYNSYIGKKVYVIDVYRSPIERKISAFFENIEFHFNNNQSQINNYNINKIFTRFNNIFPYIYQDDYFSEKYNISLPKKFDHENKYLLVVDNNISYIKLRLKDSDIWNTILTKLLGEEIFIINDYETNNKVISILYNKMKEQYRLPLNYLEIIKQCKHLNYYYSNEERSEYIKTWNTKTDPFYKSYSEKEYSQYCKISNENSVYSIIQMDHYIDNGCLCKGCCIKRINILIKHKNKTCIYATTSTNTSTNYFY